MKKLFLILFFLTNPAGPAGAFTLSHLDSPESFIVDPEDGSYYVSNINGSPSAKDGNGYISKIDAGGNTVIQHFIGGKKDELLLNAPKGLAVVGENLFVTDIDAVKAFNKKTGKPAVIVDLSKLKARFLNDSAADDRGVLYVSDTMTNQLFKIDTQKNYAAALLKESGELGQPNGLLVNPKSKNLMVVTWGSGRLLEIDRSGRIHILKRGLKTLDGIDYDGQGNLYVSNYEKGEIYKIAFFGRGALTTLQGGLTTPADISYDRKKDELLIPSSKGNTVTTVPTGRKSTQ